MDLSPELRNRVYQEVLILDNSFTCFPQILAASKQMNSEASTILYGDNLIDVRMFSDGVYVHGTKIGGMLGDDKDHPITLSNLAWPAWRRRVGFLRFSLTHLYNPCGTKMLGLFRAQDLQDVLHSLCEILGSGHVLRSSELETRGKTTEDLLRWSPWMFSSTHLLGTLKELRFSGDVVDYSYIPRPQVELEDAITNLQRAMTALWTQFPALRDRSLTSIGIPTLIIIPHRGASYSDEAPSGEGDLVALGRKAQKTDRRDCRRLRQVTNPRRIKRLTECIAVLEGSIGAFDDLQAVALKLVREEVEMREVVN
ncbi:unnamed protein product [Zymoseptoria tritici ST99CH_1A5]|uniref:Uncharacterized protein n=1 Tax=Zymoseptoria tritici ST99CH_1A5 TaxID=1276529 RepID=A0A1Y6M0V1_ZYMTR|nr:unnamed protein product [Zymoseptoria tritici ST99CH_1A5]